MTSIGMIGAGMIAQVHTQAATDVGNPIRIVFDPCVEASSTFGNTFGCDVAPNVEMLLARDDIDSVIIATPNYKHAELAIAALRAGKHVLLEKPMALTLQDCDEIISVRDQMQRMLQMGFVCRFAPTAAKAKQSIASGCIGNVQRIRATLLRQRGIPGLGGWFTSKEYSGGGCLIDIGVHMIDLAMYMTGLQCPKRVLGQCRQTFTLDNYMYDSMWAAPVEGGTFDVEDSVHATISFQRGETLQLDVAWASHLPEQHMQNGLVIEGESGVMIVDLWGDTIAIGSAKDGKPHEYKEVVDVDDAWSDAFKEQHRTFATSVASNSLHKEAGSGEDGRLVQAVVEAVYRSDCAQQEVAIVV